MTDLETGGGTANGRPTELDRLAAGYLDRLAALDPVWATQVGRLDHETELTSLDPAAAAARAELARSTLDAARKAAVAGDRDRVALETITERLSVTVDTYDAGEWMRPLRVIGSPVQSTRMVFDGMSRETDGDWQLIGERLARVPAVLAGLEETLRAGMEAGVTSARRQALACARQARTWGGRSGRDEPGFFSRLVASYAGPDRALAGTLEAVARAADGAYAGLGEFLEGTYAPAATEQDPVGRERYALGSRQSNGLAVDPEQTYAWGYEELHRIEAEMAATAGEILPGRPLGEVVELLETDERRAIVGAENFREWNQKLLDDTVAVLDGRHFDIAPPVRRVEAMLAPPGGAAAMYYTGPSRDFRRPGRTWYPTQGRDRFPLWVEVSTCYHEGLPGHHLQVATTRWLGDRLPPFQAEMFISGHGEGWALYAERLMGELGYMENPDYRLGMLAAHAFRAARVIVDIGMHHALAVPQGESYHPGEVWTAELAVPFMAAAAGRPRSFAESEVERYLGWPGQAIAYKVGEKAWLEARRRAQSRLGSAFDLKEFHRRGLALGAVGLDQLVHELGGGA